MPVVPFLGYVATFLLLPTAIVVFGAFDGQGGITFDYLRALGEPYVVASFVHSFVVSAASSVIGAVFGALLAYAVTTGNRDGVLRRIITSACGVLALFGGVALAFAFIATIGGAGLVTVWLGNHGIDIYAHGVWLYELSGLTLVYAYFQIPLMVLVFLPALDGVQPQWREAAENLGGTTWDYWRLVAGPLLTPAFLGATLLLFANAFSAFATAAALISQGGIIIPLQISGALSSEVGLGRENFANALALAMIVMVAVVMTLYALLQRRTSRWLR
ncbi:ABC transporter permease subunit [bacterium]|nr:MAG: ABC transporter permease subunit [bacterium]